jgi:serine/threonine protein phosphatase PrpC
VNGNADVLIGLRTDRGRRRKRNEDRALACVIDGSMSAGPLVCLLAVADGMGGTPGGAQASELAIRTLEAGFHPTIDRDPVTSLRILFQEANAEIHALAGSDPAYEGMGSTLVAALLARNTLWVANVGDSRAYLVRNGAIRQLTEDHSWVGEQVKAGHMSRAEAAKSPRRNVITRSLGTEDTVDVDTFGFGDLQPGDVLVLCSDGLHGVVPSADIAPVATGFAPQEAADRLVELANQRGGPDNIAVVVARWIQEHAEKVPSQPSPTSIARGDCRIA